MELVSFDDTLGEMESLIELNLLGKKIIAINYAALYTTIDEYEQSVAQMRLK